MSNDDETLAHTRCNFKYHIVFSQNYGRKVIYGKLIVSIVQILKKFCEIRNIH